MIKKIVLIGSGNVAWHLGRALYEADMIILQVYSRQLPAARKLARQIKAAAVNQVEKINPSADLYLFAITDTAIQSVAKTLAAQRSVDKQAIFAHTSGATPMDIFKGTSKRYGIFYPLQTFSSSRTVDMATVPFCINGNYQLVKKKLTGLARKLSPTVTLLSDNQRAQLHVAAVFANNFTNHLFTISQQLLNEHDLPFDLLRPLILETAHKVQHQSPAVMQTGPARRNDQPTIDRHLHLLSKHKAYQDLYKQLSALIKNYKGNE